MGIGAAISIVAWVFACFGLRRRSLSTFAVLVVTFTLVASVWTYEFALPASLAWDSGATRQAQETLLQLSHDPKGQDGVPSAPCTDVSSGSVGALIAPYRECAAYTNEGHFVTYDSVKDPGRGLGYTDVGAATFPDECSRHLVGEWWMYVEDGSGMGTCPIGYHFQGGG
jgi:hypothetical protein